MIHSIFLSFSQCDLGWIVGLMLYLLKFYAISLKFNKNSYLYVRIHWLHFIYLLLYGKVFSMFCYCKSPIKRKNDINCSLGENRLLRPNARTLTNFTLTTWQADQVSSPYSRAYWLGTPFPYPMTRDCSVSWLVSVASLTLVSHLSFWVGRKPFWLILWWVWCWLIPCVFLFIVRRRAEVSVWLLWRRWISCWSFISP